MIFFSESDITFIYPDMQTVLVGQFKDGVMIKAKPAKIIAERCNDGIKEIKVSTPKIDAPILKYKRATRLNMGDQPTVMDPYEKANVYVGELEWGGDGLFAKRNVEMNEIIVYYGGIFWNSTELKLFSPNQTAYEW